MAGFRITAGAAAAGWVPAVGDALRGIGKALGAAMLPPNAEAFRVAAPPLFRIVAGARVCRLERRIHGTPTGRCSRGRWEILDRGDTPANAREWGKLARFWTWYAVEVSEGRTPEWSWATDPGKDPNRCRTRAHADRHEPSGGGGPGRGSKGKGIPSRGDAFGYAPAAGVRLVQTPADERAARKHRARIARRERHALRNGR